MIDELYQKLSDNRAPSDKTDFTASKIYTLLENPFTLWCCLFAPASEAVHESNRYEQMQVRNDWRLKDEWLASRFPEAARIEGSGPAQAFRSTLEAMAQGAAAIAKPCLWNLRKNMYGRANLLVRVEGGRSRFGPYHYEIRQLKQGLDLKDHYALQAAFLNDILSAIQGWQAPTVKVYLRQQERVVVQQDWNARLAAELEIWAAIRDGKITPEPGRPPNAALSPWRVYANRLAAEKKDLVMLAGLGWDMRAKLRQTGLADTKAVAGAGPEKLQAILGEQLAPEVYANAVAYERGEPVARCPSSWPPPRKSRHLYFDFETSDSPANGQPPHTYLIGVWDKERAAYKGFMAKGEADEERIFNEFLDYAGDPGQTVLYHWTEYELNHIKDVAQKYPALKTRLAALLPACVDLKEAVKKSFYIPAPSFSLKAAAPALGFKWRQNDCGAMDAMVYYWDWLAGDETVLEKILAYNEDDCLAMLRIDERLSGGKYGPV